MYRGRIRVQLKNDDGTPFLEQFRTRHAVLVYLAEMIPQLKSRTSKAGGASGGGGHHEYQQGAQSQAGGKKKQRKK